MNRTTSSNRNFDRSGPSRSLIAVDEVTSATSTETIRRSPTGMDMHELYASGCRKLQDAALQIDRPEVQTQCVRECKSPGEPASP
jgi:hypothetical protein